MSKSRSAIFLLPAYLLLLYLLACNTAESPRKLTHEDSIRMHLLDSGSHHYVIDSNITYGNEYYPDREEYQRVKNLLEFHTRDTMRVDSTYIATLAMGKDISPAELEAKVSDISEPGGKVMVVDSTQEISFRMSATLEDKATEKDPNFLIELLGGKSDIRTYDEKKNKMVWQWNVTPLKQGNHELILSISQVDETGLGIGSPETRHHSITIFSRQRKGSLGKGIGNFIEKYWQWLIGVIGLPLFIAWFTTRRRNAMQNPHAKTAKKEIKNRKK
ncbi:MAG: hypothetical protein HZB42_07140 [Sphingobacteriales bacterium]|nr:hypothetical protein [Sphingobacteriales bacterium]